MRSIMRQAVELLLANPDVAVARTLDIRIERLRRWMKLPRFSEALREAEQCQARQLARLARAAALDAAISLCRGAPDSLKPDAKTALELLKLSRAYEPLDDEYDSLADIIRQTAGDD